MHEHAIVDDLISEAQKHGKVIGITVDVGELAPITVMELKEALKAHQPDWKIEIVQTEALVQCKDCGFEGQPEIVERAHDFVLFECPNCACVPEVLAGKDIVLKSVDVE